MLKVGLIGSGFIGEDHAEAIAGSDKVELAAVVNRSEESGRKLADKYNCKYYQSAEEMLEKEDIDFIDICVATHVHEEMVLLGAKHKVHVLCEKPVTLTLESLDRMIDATEKAGVKFMVAQVIRFWPEYVKIKEMLDNGDFGRIKMVYANRLSQFPAWMGWNTDPNQSGGGLYDLHLHDIDVARFMFGEADSVYAVGYKNEDDCWNHVVTSLTFKNGVTCAIEGAYEMTDDFPFTMTYRVVGQDVTAEYNLGAGMNLEDPSSFRRALMRYETGKAPVKVPIDELNAYQLEIDYFADCIAEDKEPELVPIEESRDVIRIMLAIKESLETGKVIKL
ncbi:MAG: Gfo/Idh/MocA family oxidoreductase [Clostridiales bacterium]|nr:Gfo/Idh/MocA family oxidoreductase [Clostridiales bacterium]